MGLFNWLNPFRTNLSQQDRDIIWRYFGSFTANQFATKGNAIIQNSYERNIDVYAIIKKIIDTSKAIPWVIEQRQANGNWKELKDTTLHELMHTPNVGKDYSWDDIDEQVILYLLCTGNSYLHGETQFNSSIVQELDVLPPSFVCIESNNSFFAPEIKFRFTLGTTNKVFDKTNVAHIKFFNPGYCSVLESHYGLSPIQVAARAIQAGNDRLDATTNMFQNRGAFGLITDRSNRPMDAEQAKTVQEAFEKRSAGTGNFGKTIVTNKDLNYIQMAMSPQDLQLIEHGVISTREICNVFGVDSSLFNDPDNKTYSNRTEAEKSLYTNAIIPISTKRAANYTTFLCPNHFPGKTVRLRQDFSDVEVLQENFKDRATTVAMLKDSGIITPNEAREALNEEPSTDPSADMLSIKQNNIPQNNNNLNN